MIALLNGVCAEVAENRIILDVGGIGFELIVPLSALDQFPVPGEPLTMHTFLSVREDGMTLYGFRTREELSTFKKLISVSGVGPKAALALLGAMRVEDLRFAILTSDTRAIAQAQGIGKKTAERLVLELKDKFAADEYPARAEGAAVSAEGGAQEETVQALAALGYGASEALRAVKSAVSRQPEMALDTEKLLKAALKELI